MLSVQPWGVNGANEELRSVGIRPGICHGQDSLSLMSQVKVFVRKSSAVNGFSTGTIVVCEVSTLTHKLRNDAMEGAALVACKGITTTKMT